MTRTKNLGVWMNHLDANLIEYTLGPMGTRTIEIEKKEPEHKLAFADNVNFMHNNEQIAQMDYFKNLIKTIKSYDEIILFGPTNEKLEFQKILKEDKQLSNINIEVKETNELTEAEQKAYVKDHFSRH